MTIRRQMMVWIAAPTLAIYVAILGLTLVKVYRQARGAAEQNMRRLAASYAERFDAQLQQVERIAQTTANFMETVGTLPDDEVYAQLARNVESTPLVYGAALAFEPPSADPHELHCPYVHRSPMGLQRLDIDADVYDWYSDPQYTWYQAPKRIGREVWSEPYFDEGAGNILMATYSAPFDLEGKFGGVTTVDVDLPRLEEFVGSAFSEKADFVVLTEAGQFVYDRQTERILSKTIFDVAEETQNPALAALGEKMLAGEPGMATIDDWDHAEPQWVFYAPIPSADWVIACRVPESVALGDVRRQMLWTGAGATLTLGLIVACIFFVARRIAAPLAELSEKVGEVGKGRLETKIDEQSPTTEIRRLARSFNHMTSELRMQVERLAVEQSARQRIERDLDIAREIQQSLLPSAPPTIACYEVAGWSRPADKTGGDYYDWQTLAAGQTLISLADVSGHGVGPALVTAVCRAYTRASFATGQDLQPLMGRLNDLLFSDLPDGRFVTFAAMLYDPQADQVRLLSAGHGPILHYHAAEHRLQEHEAHGLPLGVVPDHEYAAPTPLSLAPGDFVLLLTDGFFEWPRPDGESLGLARLRETLLTLAHLPAAEMIRELYAAAQTFAEGTPQPDDVTAVVLRRVVAG